MQQTTSKRAGQQSSHCSSHLAVDDSFFTSRNIFLERNVLRWRQQAHGDGDSNAHSGLTRTVRPFQINDGGIKMILLYVLSNG